MSATFVPRATADLDDVSPSAPSDGQLLTWVASTSLWTPRPAPSVPVSSVFGRTGAVMAQAGDYSVGQVTGAAADSAVVHLAGTETIAGAKTFTGGITLGGQPLSAPALTPAPSAPLASLPQVTWYPASGTNVGTALAVAPRGTGDPVTGIRSQVTIFGTDPFADATNYSFASFRATASAVTFFSSKSGTGTILPFRVQTSTTGGPQANRQLYCDPGTLGLVGINNDSPSGAALDINVPSQNTSALYLRLSQIQAVPALPIAKQSSTLSSRDVAYLDGGFISNTDASYTGYADLDAVDYAGRRKGVRVASDGTRALVGFFGATAVAKPTITGSRGGNAALASLLTELANLGLLTDSTTA